MVFLGWMPRRRLPFWSAGAALFRLRNIFEQNYYNCDCSSDFPLSYIQSTQRNRIMCRRQFRLFHSLSLSLPAVVHFSISTKINVLFTLHFDICSCAHVSITKQILVAPSVVSMASYSQWIAFWRVSLLRHFRIIVVSDAIEQWNYVTFHDFPKMKEKKKWAQRHNRPISLASYIIMEDKIDWEN